MENKIYYHSECDFHLEKVNSISNWIEETIYTEKKTLGEITYIFCDDEYLLKKNQEYLQMFLKRF